MKNEPNKNDIPNDFDIPDQLNIAQGVQPFTRYKVIELCVCALAVVLGLLYLYTDMVTLNVLLPLYSVFFCAIASLRYLDTRANGLKGFAAMLPVICWTILAIAVIAATVTYFVQQ